MARGDTFDSPERPKVTKVYKGKTRSVRRSGGQGSSSTGGNKLARDSDSNSDSDNETDTPNDDKGTKKEEASKETRGHSARSLDDDPFNSVPNIGPSRVGIKRRIFSHVELPRYPGYKQRAAALVDEDAIAYGNTWANLQLSLDSPEKRAGPSHNAAPTHNPEQPEGLKRKRGRPPKVSLLAMNEFVEAAKAPSDGTRSSFKATAQIEEQSGDAKRKPGRRRKVPTLASNEFVEPIQAPSDGADSSSQVPAQTEEQSTNVKRKRGRPPNTSSLATNEFVEAAKAPSERAGSSSHAPSQTEEQSVGIKRKPGRPPKVPKLAKNESEEVVKTQSEDTPSQRRKSPPRRPGYKRFSHVELVLWNGKLSKTPQPPPNHEPLFLAPLSNQSEDDEDETPKPSTSRVRLVPNPSKRTSAHKTVLPDSNSPQKVHALQSKARSKRHTEPSKAKKPDERRNSGSRKTLSSQRAGPSGKNKSMVKFTEEDFDIEMSPPPSLPKKITDSEKRSRILQQLRLRKSEKQSAGSPSQKPRSQPLFHESEVEETSSETESSDDEDGSSSHTSAASDFIEDDLNAGPEPTTSRRSPVGADDDTKLKTQFWVCVHYMIHIDINADIFDEVDKDTRKYFLDALMAVKDITHNLAGQIARTTWKAPFRTTLELRPRIKFVSLEHGTKCQACWSAHCYPNGFYKFTSSEGVYDADTLKDLVEQQLVISKHEEEETEPPDSSSSDDSSSEDANTPTYFNYITKTEWEKNAEAPAEPHPPDFSLFVGSTCARRGQTFHSAYHCLYELSGAVARVVQDLRRRRAPAILAADEQLGTRKADMIFDYMDKNGNIKTLWRTFQANLQKWRPK